MKRNLTAPKWFIIQISWRARMQEQSRIPCKHATWTCIPLYSILTFELITSTNSRYGDQQSRGETVMDEISRWNWWTNNNCAYTIYNACNLLWRSFERLIVWMMNYLSFFQHSFTQSVMPVCSYLYERIICACLQIAYAKTLAIAKAFSDNFLLFLIQNP